jgi:transmembrane sensor
MLPDDVAQLRKDLELPWNDLREQRVLGRIQEARRAGRRRRAMRLAGAASSVVLAVATCVALLLVRGQGWQGGAARPVAESSDPQQDGGQRIALADGSQALLVRDAQIRVSEQTPERVHIAQASGEVRYDVRPDPAREFVVTAPGIRVRVRGTLFAVAVAADRVEVRVERGRVEVDDGIRTRELSAGESLGIPSRGTPAVDEGHHEAPAEAPIPAAAMASPASRPSFERMLAEADQARAEGRQDDAVMAITSALAAFPRDGRVPSALFSLGKVERARQRFEASAMAFDRCWRAAPNGPLAQDALAEAASSWARAGRFDAARADADRYLERWPDGIESVRMRALSVR